MKKLITRTLSAFVFAIIVIGAIFMGQYAYSLLFLFVSIVCMNEYYRALQNKGIKVNAIEGIIIGSIMYCITASVSLFNYSPVMLLLLFPTLLLLWILQLWKSDENPFQTISYTACGVVYISIPLVATLFLAKPTFIGISDYTPLVMLGILVLQWVSDSFAYLTGVCIGRHPLFKRHSPKKSWEGFVGGFTFCILAGYLIGTYIDTPFATIDWIVMATIVPVIGTLGDLVESMFKRSMDIKDTGNIMPGHGGLLDRFDSLIMVTPFLLGYLLLKYLVL